VSIQVKNISKEYGNQKALDKVSFELKKGEIVGFLGPNGAGKSTLMKIIVGYLDADQGKVLINDFDVATETLEAQKIIGYLPEHNPLYTDMYIKEYLNFLAGIRNIAAEQVDVIVQKTGLTPELGKKIKQLSKGYKQRVGLAAALLHDPEVLILDEPTTGLDPNQLVEIRALVKKVGSDKMVLFSSHIMQEVEAICDRVLLIHHGRILADQQLATFKGENKQVLEVTFETQPDLALLEKLPNLLSHKSEDQLAFELIFDTQEDMRSVVFDFATKNNLRILELNAKSINLEDMFRELTASST
jgi:ABC-2 type transport system ATP-binding protein